MTTTRRSRLLVFALVYFVQGAALAYFRNFQKPYLDGFGVDADLIGLLTSILLIPFVLKIFIGMLSDRVNLFGQGHRKPYMLLGLGLAAAAFGAAAFVNPGSQFGLFAALIVLGSFSVALFDSTTDGLAIDVTPPAEQGMVQGVMVGGRAVGFVVLSLLFGLLATRAGYPVVFAVIGVMMLLPVVWVLALREPAEREISQQFEPSAFAALARPGFLLFAAYAIWYSVVSFGVDGLVTFYMSEGFSAPETAIGTYGAMRGVGAALGALGAGLLLERIGRRRAAVGAAVAISAGAALLGAVGSIPAFLAMGLVWGVAWGVQETVFVALAMSLADARIAASAFAIMMALSNVGTAIGEGVATGLTDNIGFAPVFWLLAGLNVITFPLLWLLFRAAPGIGAVPAAAD